jgi:hypothetical protein
MSTSNKKNVLLAFGALAIVLVAVLAIWRPPALRNEDVSGAIGAVEKHRQPQIAQQDVILGDEATREEQSVVFGDFLNDSAKLQSISNTVGAMAANKLDSRQVDAAAKNLGEISNDLQARYAARLSAFVTAANRVTARSENRKLAADIADLGLRLNAKLAQADMETVNAKVAAITAAAGARAESKASINFAQRAMNEAADALQARNGPQAASKLASATEELNARAYGASLAQISAYLQAITMEAKVISAAQSRLAALGVEPINESRIQLLSKELASQSLDLESRAVKNMAARVEDQTEVGAKLQAIDAQLQNANRLAGSQASAMASRADSISAAMDGARTALASRGADFAAKTASSIELELGALNAYRSRAEAGARVDARLAARAADNRINMSNHLMAVRNLAARPEIAAKVNSRVLNEAAELQQRLAAKSN